MKKGPELTSPYINALEPYSAPSPIEEIKEKYGLNNPARLDCNENPCGPSPMAIKAMAKAIAECNYYPESSCLRLREKLAKLYGIKPDMITMGNGGDNILTCFAETYALPGDEVIIGHPSFSSYYRVFPATGSKLVLVPLKDFCYDLDAILKSITAKTKIIVICNPNNPTSTMVNKKQMDDFMAKVPQDIIVLIDEAYGPFAPAGFPDSLEYIRDEKNVLILRTFSKFFGLAGLRAGYLTGAEHLINTMKKYQEVFSLNFLAQIGAEAALDDEEFARLSLKTVITGRDYLTQELKALGVRVYPSAANFIFADFQRDAIDLSQKLTEKGYLIRPFPATYLRITIGTMEQNTGLISALKKILA